MAKKQQTTKALTIQKPEALAAELSKEASSLQKTADKLQVTNQGDYQKGGMFIAELKAARDQFEVKRKEITKPLDEAKKRVMALFKPPVDQLTAAIGTVDKKLIAYVETEEEKVRKAAEAEAKKVLKKTGNRELAEDIKQTKIEAATPQASGVQVLSFWHAEVESLTKLVRAVATGQVPIEALQANEVYLNKLARLHQDNAKAPPGVKFVEERKTGRTASGGLV